MEKVSQKRRKYSMIIVESGPVNQLSVTLPPNGRWINLLICTRTLERENKKGGTALHYIQELLGHANPKTREIYTQVGVRDIRSIQSPLNCLKNNVLTNEELECYAKSAVAKHPRMK